MAEIDRQKEIISFFKTSFFFTLGLIAGLSGYIFNNYEKMSEIKLIILNLIEAALIVIIFLIGFKLKKEIDKIKDL